MPLNALPFVLLQGFLFGSTLIASRFSVGQFSPTTYIGLRLILASLGHLAIYGLVKGRSLPKDRALWRHAAMLGVFGTAVPMTFIVSSLQYQSSGVTALLITAGPAVTVLMAQFLLPEERLRTREGLGVALALGGAVLLAVRGETGLPNMSQASPVGYGLVLLAMIAASGMTIYARKFMQQFDAFDVASVRMFAAALSVMPLSVLLVGFDLGNVDIRGYSAMVYAAATGTFGGHMIAFYVTKRFGATASAMPAYVIPVVASIGGALILNESISPGMVAGMALIILGIRLINRSESQPSGRAATVDEPTQEITQL